MAISGNPLVLLDLLQWTVLNFVKSDADVGIDLTLLLESNANGVENKGKLPADQTDRVLKCVSGIMKRARH